MSERISHLSTDYTSQSSMDTAQNDEIGSPHASATTKKNKLGYTRISIACEHCRRRKIRCVKDDEAAEKCANCTKLNKSCIFTTIDSSVGGDSKSKSKKATASGASSAFQPSPTGSRSDVYDLSGGGFTPNHAQPYVDGALSYHDGSRMHASVLASNAVPLRPQPQEWMSDHPAGYVSSHLQPGWSPHPSQARAGAYIAGSDLPQNHANHHYYVGHNQQPLAPQSWAIQETPMTTAYPTHMQPAPFYAPPPFYTQYQSHVEQRQTTTQAHQMVQPHLYTQSHVVPSNQSEGQSPAWQHPGSMLQPPHLVGDARHDSMATAANWPRGSSFLQNSSKPSSMSAQHSRDKELTEPPD